MIKGITNNELSAMAGFIESIKNLNREETIFLIMRIRNDLPVERTEKEIGIILDTYCNKECKHEFIRTTKNYKHIYGCALCGKIKNPK